MIFDVWILQFNGSPVFTIELVFLRVLSGLGGRKGNAALSGCVEWSAISGATLQGLTGGVDLFPGNQERAERETHPVLYQPVFSVSKRRSFSCRTSKTIFTSDFLKLRAQKATLRFRSKVRFKIGRRQPTPHRSVWPRYSKDHRWHSMVLYLRVLSFQQLRVVTLGAVSEDNIQEGPPWGQGQTQELPAKSGWWPKTRWPAQC